MTYDPNIPAASDFIADSQGGLLTNFGQLDTIMAVNHVAFSDGSADKGKHKFVQFTQQSQTTIDALNVSSSEIAIYNKADGTDPELYMKRNGGVETQLTRDGLLYIGMHPVVAVNFAPASLPTLASSYNVASVTGTGGLYTINFTNPVTNPSGANTNGYFWNGSAMAASGGLINVGVQPSGTYSNSVQADKILIRCTDRSGNLTTPLRVVLTVWKFQ